MRGIQEMITSDARRLPVPDWRSGMGWRRLIEGFAGYE